MIKSRFSNLKLAAVVAVLAITICAGALLVFGHTNPPQRKFSVRETTTRENNGKHIRAKPGYELVKDEHGVSVRRLNKPTERASDTWACQCTTGPSSGSVATCASARILTMAAIPAMAIAAVRSKSGTQPSKTAVVCHAKRFIPSDCGAADR